MKSFLFIWHFVITLIFNACAQSIHDMQKGYAFFKESIPGNIQVDEKGNEIKPALDTVRFIFIEWKGKSSPPIDIVSYRGKIFNASIFPVEQTQVEIGQAKSSGESIILKPLKGNTLWRVVLVLSSKKNITETSNKIVLKGEKQGRPFQWVIDKEIEIQAETTK